MQRGGQRGTELHYYHKPYIAHCPNGTPHPHHTPFSLWQVVDAGCRFRAESRPRSETCLTPSVRSGQDGAFAGLAVTHSLPAPDLPTVISQGRQYDTPASCPQSQGSLLTFPQPPRPQGDHFQGCRPEATSKHDHFRAQLSLGEPRCSSSDSHRRALHTWLLRGTQWSQRSAPNGPLPTFRSWGPCTMLRFMDEPKAAFLYLGSSHQYL